MPKPPSIRSLAQGLGLSVATVSEALRHSSHVRPATRERVLKAAAEAGYSRNPLLGATFSALRLGRHQGFNSTLALVDWAQDGRDQLMYFHREVARGAKLRAGELGFGTEVFFVGRTPPALSVARLASVLKARGVVGLIFLPFDQRQDFSAFNFSQFSAVSMDHRLTNPQLHTVHPDHYLSMRAVLHQLSARGYRRIGLCVEARKDERVDFKWSSGFLSYFRLNEREVAVPPLIENTLARKNFSSWFRKYRPDLIISHNEAITGWLVELGCQVPRDVGFFRINITERTQPCAGLDLLPERLGATAVETVVGMLHRRELGIPKFPTSISIDAVFTDGPSLVPAAGPVNDLK